MFETFYPHMTADSVYNIDFQMFYRLGYRAVIFDIDNTLVPHDADADDKAKGLFRKLTGMGYKTMLLSNNDEPRVKRFNRDIGSPYIFKAGKPLKSGYKRAMEQMGTDTTNTIYVGDQLFTDVWGAKRLGIFNILTSPINPREEIQIVFKRRLEKPILKRYKKEPNIILTGCMGAGKTTIGRSIAQKFNMGFVDSDDYIVAREGMTVSEIFEKKGEEYFRELETSFLKGLGDHCRNCVISTGGGLPLRQENRDILRSLGTVFYLYADADTIYQRIKGDTGRPLLQVEDPRARLAQILSERDSIYESSADHVINTCRLRTKADLKELDRLASVIHFRRRDSARQSGRLYKTT